MGTIADIIRPEPDEPKFRWCEKNIVFRKPYDAIAEGAYDSSLTPFFREPMEKYFDKLIREIWMVKSPQSGASENCLLMPMRYCVCHAPQTLLYVSGEQKSTEEFIDERIKPGLQLSPELRRRYEGARVKTHQIYYPDMMIIMGWAQSKGIVKQRAASGILADEVAMWPGFTADELRGRLTTKAFGTIVGISTLSASDKRPAHEQPVYIEFLHTDQRYYMLPDPSSRNRKTQKMFKLEMGFRDRKTGKESPFGLKWSPDAKRKDGSWDIKVVLESAYYKTPWGSVIDDDLKTELLQEGVWTPTVRGADPSKWGGHLNWLYLPWISWGARARTWLDACAKLQKQGDKHALKVVIVEQLGEDWWDEKQSLEQDVIQERQAEYEKATLFTESDGQCNEQGDTFKEFYIGQKTLILTTVDVMKDWGMMLSREWVKSGDSGLIGWTEWHDWAEVNDHANHVKAQHVLVDSGYGERTQEVYEACWKYRFIATQGKENISDLLFSENQINPFEGTKRQKKGRKKNLITLILFRTHPMKSQLIKRINGETSFAWYVYHGIEHDYSEQATSEDCVDGVWRKHGPNHIWDCEVLQLLGATRWGFNRFKGFELVEDKEDKPAEQSS